MHLKKVVKALLFLSQLAFLSLSILCPPHIEHSVPTFVNPLCRLSLCDKGARRFRPESLCRRPLIAPFRPMDAVQHNRDSVINTCFSSVEAYSLSTSITRLI